MNKVLWILYLLFNSNTSFISFCSCVNCNNKASITHTKKMGKKYNWYHYNHKAYTPSSIAVSPESSQSALPGVLCCWMAPAPYRDRMESLESCFFATSSDFVVWSVKRSRSPDVTVDTVAAAGTEDVPWDKHQNVAEFSILKHGSSVTSNPSTVMKLDKISIVIEDKIETWKITHSPHENT